MDAAEHILNLELMSRKGCHLCEEAEHLLDQMGVPYRWLDVDSQPAWQLEYGFRVPVLLGDSQPVMEFPFSRDKLRELMLR